MLICGYRYLWTGSCFLTNQKTSDLCYQTLKLNVEYIVVQNVVVWLYFQGDLDLQFGCIIFGNSGSLHPLSWFEFGDSRGLWVGLHWWSWCVKIRIRVTWVSLDFPRGPRPPWSAVCQREPCVLFLFFTVTPKKLDKTHVWGSNKDTGNSVNFSGGGGKDALSNSKELQKHPKNC